MKTYESILLEKQITNVFHVTRFDNAKNILTHNYFRASSGLGEKGFSTTTNKDYWWGSKEVKFVLDFKKLAKDFEYEKVDEDLSYDSGNKLKEDEIRFYPNTVIKNANKYIQEIQVVKEKDPDGNFMNFLKNFNIKSRYIK